MKTNSRHLRIIAIIAIRLPSEISCLSYVVLVIIKEKRGEVILRDISNELEILKSIILDTVAVDKIILFGSYANGTPNEESDIDLYVVMKDNTEMNELDALKSIYKGLRYKLNMPIDILTGRKSSFERRAKLLTLENDIISEGITLYG